MLAIFNTAQCRQTAGEFLVLSYSLGLDMFAAIYCNKYINLYCTNYQYGKTALVPKETRR